MSSLSEMVEGLADDLDISLNPDEYPDQQGPLPVYAGNYAVRVKKFSVRKDKAGQPVLTDGKFPVFCIEQIEIVDGLDNPRTVALFQDIRTKPFERMNYNTNRKEAASTVADMTRAYDQSLGWDNLKDGIEVLEGFMASGDTFNCQLNWTAYDSAYAKSAIEAAGGKERLTKDELNAIYNKAKVRGMKKFPQTPDGRPNHMWEGPSGNDIEARVEITRFYPSHEPVKLGSFYKKAA